jgi:hypothetical protein
MSKQPIDKAAAARIQSATACVFKFGKEPEDHHAVAVPRSRRHAGQDP